MTKEAIEILRDELKKPDTYGWHFDFWTDYASFAFWRPMNWRNFTVIMIDGEVSGYKGDGWYEFHVALLGFHFMATHTAKPGRKLAEAIEAKEDWYKKNGAVCEPCKPLPRTPFQDDNIPEEKL